MEFTIDNAKIIEEITDKLDGNFSVNVSDLKNITCNFEIEEQLFKNIPFIQE